MMRLLSLSSLALFLLLLVPDAVAGDAQLTVRDRHRHGHLPTAAELLEKDVLAAGGKPLAEDAIPCAFSFHSNVKSALAITCETTHDPSAPSSEMQNVLEWLYGVSYSYALGIQYAWMPMFSPDKHLGSLWARFLGFQQGEVTLDDLNQRHGEGTVTLQNIDHRDSTKDTLAAFEAHLARVEGRTKENAPSIMYWVRRPQELSSTVLCHAPMLRTLRQKYCAARALRPVPFSLYTTPAGPPPKSHPIHIAVQLASSLHPASGQGDAKTILGNLPASMEEYIDMTGLAVAQLLQTLRRHTRAALHVHLFASPPLKREHTETPSPLLTLEKHPMLRQVIAGDTAANALNEGMILESHFHISHLHAFHHQVMADILIADWTAYGLLASALNEGIVLIPNLPHQARVTNPVTPFYDLPVCTNQVLKYEVRKPETPAEADSRAEKQAVRFQEFFAKDEAGLTIISLNSTAVASSSSVDLIPSRFEIPLRRIVRRRHAEAYALTTAFTTAAHSLLQKPNALAMRHCQAIPEPTIMEPQSEPSAMQKLRRRR